MVTRGGGNTGGTTAAAAVGAAAAGVELDAMGPDDGGNDSGGREAGTLPQLQLHDDGGGDGEEAWVIRLVLAGGGVTGSGSLGGTGTIMCWVTSVLSFCVRYRCMKAPCTRKRPPPVNRY